MILTAKSILKYSSITIFSIAFIIYLYAQSITYLRGPSLEIRDPVDGTSAQTNTVIISGTAVRVAFIYLNDLPIFVTEQGEFNEKLILSPGYNIIKVRVVDKFKREIIKQLHITYNQSADDPPLDTVIKSIKQIQSDNSATTTTTTQPETVDNNN